MPIQPNDHLDIFLQQTKDTYERYDVLYNLVLATSKDDLALGKLALRKSLTSDAVFTLGGLWELFQHNWHVTAAVRDTSILSDRAQKRLQADLSREGRFVLDILDGKVLQQRLRMTGRQAEQYLDPTGFNLTFTNVSEWAKVSRQHHAYRYSSKVAALKSDHEQTSVLDLLKQIRNALAHGSTASLTTFNQHVRLRGPNDAVGLVGASNTALVRAGGNRVRDINTYLHTWVPSGDYSGYRRISVLFTRVREAAELLRV